MPSSGSCLPARRVVDLIITEIGSDLIVYDEPSQTLHTLNKMTDLVWRALDGTRTLDSVAAETGLPNDVVQQALNQLTNANLLSGNLDASLQMRETRRGLLRKVAVGGSVAIPMLTSTTAVQSVMAASCATGCYGVASTQVSLSRGSFSSGVSVDFVSLEETNCTTPNCDGCFPETFATLDTDPPAVIPDPDPGRIRIQARMFYEGHCQGGITNQMSGALTSLLQTRISSNADRACGDFSNVKDEICNSDPMPQICMYCGWNHEGFRMISDEPGTPDAPTEPRTSETVVATEPMMSEPSPPAEPEIRETVLPTASVPAESGEDGTPPVG